MNKTLVAKRMLSVSLIAVVLLLLQAAPVLGQHNCQTVTSAYIPLGDSCLVWVYYVICYDADGDEYSFSCETIACWEEGDIGIFLDTSTYCYSFP